MFLVLSGPGRASSAADEEALEGALHCLQEETVHWSTGPWYVPRAPGSQSGRRGPGDVTDAEGAMAGRRVFGGVGRAKGEILQPKRG